MDFSEVFYLVRKNIGKDLKKKTFEQIKLQIYLKQIDIFNKNETGEQYEVGINYLNQILKNTIE